ncbi:glycosyltransferase [Agathobaculum sp. LCP25S3_E8]|uniref:glycosyltransferase n=1 Tax=Agathobaculum sp. LCP25S3_E8 TaxID=3438735 RepID=UPI003F8F7361
MKKKNAIMLADTRPALIGHMLLQIRDTNRENFDEVIVLDTQIPEQDKKLMQDIMPCRFIPYCSPISEKLLEMERFQRFSLIMFGRYEMFRLLDEYSLIMWIDTDMVIQGDLRQLLEDTEGYGLSILREDPKNKSSKNVDYMRTNFIHAVEEYDMDSYLCCTGLIIVRDVLQQDCDYTQWCYDKTLEWADNLNLPDQGVINALIQHFNIDIYPIGHNGTYGCFPYIGRDCSKAILIHSWGSNKFWNDYYLNQTFPAWERTYQDWLQLGGSVLERKQVPEVSVVIPVYKPDLGYFKQCIDSLTEQKKNGYEAYSNFEVIIIAEPFEQQATQKLVDSYKDVRLNLYFNEKRLGIAASLNRGMRLATGKYIARLDDDDIAAPYRLQKQVEYLESNPDITLCTSDYLYFGDMNDGRVAMEGEMAKAWSVLTCPFDHPTIMFRKDFFIKNELFYDETRGYVEDWELWQRAFKKNMHVGCVHDILLYHRWHNGSAGQNNKTVVMMREMIKNNFQELGVEVPDEDLPLLSPWSGKVTADADYKRLEQYFRDAIERNNILKLYDSFSLAHVFSLRLTEARTGQLDAITIKRIEESQTEQHQDIVKKTSFKKTIKRFLKRLIKPLYQPFRHRYEDRLIEITNLAYSQNDRLNRTLAMIESKEKIINNIVARFENISKSIDLMSLNQEKYANAFHTALLHNQEKLGNKIDEKVFEECENTRQMLSQKVFEECENTRQMLSGKVFEENELSRHMILAQVHRHIDFTYRDIMVAMERQRAFLPKHDIHLITDYPIAYESLDYLYPHGTIRDNTRYPRFVERCEEILGQKNGLSFLDLGCSGGGMVLEAALRGHISMGLEGSDSSKKEQRAEWRLLGERLQTCDITKQFRLETPNGNLKKFDIISAWEVMEHIAENDLPQMLENIKMHLSNTGYFVASIANWDDIDPETGVNWHVTLHEYQWWVQQFEKAGFAIRTELFQPIDLARGTYNPPHCYETPYPAYDQEKNFYIVACLAK